MKTSNINKQLGFTLTEMVIVVIIITLLTVGLTSSYSRYKENAKITVLQKIILEKIPSAIAGYRGRVGTTTGMTVAALIDNGVPSITPWGQSWTISLSASYVDFSFPLSSSGFALSTGSDVASFLTNSGATHLISSSFNAATKTFSARVRL